jgi:hypothetical protein
VELKQRSTKVADGTTTRQLLVEARVISCTGGALGAFVSRVTIPHVCSLAGRLALIA